MAEEEAHAAADVLAAPEDGRPLPERDRRGQGRRQEEEDAAAAAGGREDIV